MNTETATESPAASTLPEQGLGVPRLVRWFVRKWDWWIYRRSYKSINRMCVGNAGFAYLFQLHIEDWLKENPIPESLKSATESFYETQKTEREKSQANAEVSQRNQKAKNNE